MVTLVRETAKEIRYKLKVLIVLAAVATLGVGYWVVFRYGPLTTDDTLKLRLNLRDWQFSSGPGTLIFHDEQNRSYRLAGDFNRFRLHEWNSAWEVFRPGPFDLTVDRDTSSDPIDLYEIGRDELKFMTLADINAWRAQDRKMGFGLLAGCAAFLALGIWALARQIRRETSPPLASTSAPARSFWPKLSQPTETRLLSLLGVACGIGAAYYAFIVPLQAAARHQNKVEISTTTVVAAVALILMPLPFLIAPTRSRRLFGTAQNLTSAGMVLCLIVGLAAFGVHWLFKSLLAQIGYQS